MVVIEDLDKEESEDEEDEDESDDEGPYELVGCLEPAAETDRQRRFSRFFFPSKVGGRPAWMVPEKLPRPVEELSCKKCSQRLKFLLQVYASQGEADENAFHRSILLFVCTTCQPNEARAFRVQLPRANALYGMEAADAATAQEPEEPDAALADLCCPRCGMPAPEAPEPCADCTRLAKYKEGPAVFSERELVVGAAAESDDEDGEDLLGSDGEAIDESDAPIPADTGNPAIDKRLQALRKKVARDPSAKIDRTEEKVFEEFCTKRGMKDDAFNKFQRFSGQNPGHVLRYELGGDALWYAAPKQWEGPPRCCELCGGERVFEFQVQPQLIMNLGESLIQGRMEFGTICVYTCKDHCQASADSPYVEEFVYVQPEPTEDWLPPIERGPPPDGDDDA